MSKYSVKGVKKFRGREGHGFNASLYRDGKRVATVDNMANGGEFNWHWLDYNKDRVTVEVTRYGRTHSRKCTPEEALFIDHIKGKTYTFNGHEGNHNEDTYAEELVAVSEMAKVCKKKTAFTLVDSHEDEYLVINIPYSAEGKRWLQNEYGDQLKEILNEKFVEAVTV